MWPIWFRSEISSGKDFEILWKFVIFQIFISTVLSNPTVLMLSPTVLMLSLHCTEYPPQYWCYPSTVLMLSPCMYWCCPPNVLNTLHSIEPSPHCTDVIPPLYWTTSTVLKVSPHSTEAIPHMYCCYPPTVPKVSLHSTEYPPQYWCVSPTVLMLSPTVLNNLHSTDVIPHCTEQPPQYWSYPPTVLKLSPWCTEQPPQYLADVIWGDTAPTYHRLYRP